MIDRICEKVLTFLEDRKWRYIYKNYRRKYNLPGSFKFGAHGTIIYGNGRLEVGDNSYMNQVWIQLAEGEEVKIGRNCRFAHNIRIYTSSVIPDEDLDRDPWTKDRNTKKGGVIIGNGVWIGANVFINPGIKIGDNVVIGANSVVTKNVESFSIIGGVPARLIRMKE